MSITNKLASSLSRRDEAPNQELAVQIASQKDTKAVLELIDNLNNKSKGIQNDCIKVLYEIGEITPSLISAYNKEFLALLDHKNNRIQWGAMIALNTIVLEVPQIIYKNLSKIIESAEKGSVITKDYAINILIKLCFLKRYSGNTFSLLNEQLLKSPTNQLPMYAEKAIPIINKDNRQFFIKTLTSRLSDIEKDSKRKRVEKVIKKIRG